MPRFGPPRACSARFSLDRDRSPGFGSTCDDFPPFRTRFRSGSACPRLSLATAWHSSAHSTKGTPSPLSGLRPAGSARFQVYFTPLAGVLFTVPSRYWSTVGRRRYLALGRGRPCFTPGTSCLALLTQQPTPHTCPSLRGSHPLRRPVPAAFGCPMSFERGPCRVPKLPVQPRNGIAGRLCRRPGLGSSPFARRYSGNPLFSSGY